MTKKESAAAIHKSVLLDECMNYLLPQAGNLYVDGTLGLGGHTEAILQKSEPDGLVVGFDWDSEALTRARERLQNFGKRLLVQQKNFAEIEEGLKELKIDRIDGLLIDIGVSSLQLDSPDRGFSFQHDQQLDMRMDRRREVTAETILAVSTEKQLADIFYYYGEERQARPIAAAIVEYRKKGKICTTKQLATIVARAIPKRFHQGKFHVATKVFQALRIAVNTELENLATIIDCGAQYLRPGGRFCVISFHSLEDRIVKKKFKENSLLEVVTKKPVTPSQREVDVNPRSRSARLRVAEKRSDQ